MNEKRVAIVTGASSGIGMETALALAGKKYAVVLAARRRDRLEEVAERCREMESEAMVARVDVAKSGEVDSLVAATVDRFGRVDVMVNNAGCGLFARVWEISPEQMREILEVNFFGVFYGCRAVAPVMMRQRSGHIFNVSSVIGKRGTPFHGAYCATKFAVCGLTDSLRVEMNPSNVRVTCVCPTVTKTEFFSHSAVARRAESSFHRITRHMSAARVGRKIAATVGRRKPELVFSMGGKFLVALSSLWPRGADAIMKLYHNDLTKSLQEGPTERYNEQAESGGRESER